MYGLNGQQCPHCDYEMVKAADMIRGDADWFDAGTCDFECPNCERTLQATVEITVEFTVDESENETCCFCETAHSTICFDCRRPLCESHAHDSSHGVLCHKCMGVQGVCASVRA